MDTSTIPKLLSVMGVMTVYTLTKNEMKKSPLIFGTGLAGGGVAGYIVGGILQRVME